MANLLNLPFYYMRHGLTDWNLEDRAMGQADIPLNTAGREQARSATASLVDLAIDAICFSPLLRAQETAEIVNESLQLPMFPIDELKEFNLGLFQGQRFDTWIESWRQGEPLEGAELFLDFAQRVLEGMNRALKAGTRVLIVAHGGVYRAVQRHIELPQAGIPNCVPILHLPPNAEEPKWRVSPLNRRCQGP